MASSRIHDLTDIGVPADDDVLAFDDVSSLTVAKRGTVANLASRIFSLLGLDEDDFASDSDTKFATQQSTKAYVDTEVAAVSGGGRGTAAAVTLDGSTATLARSTPDQVYDITVEDTQAISLANMINGDVWVLNLLGDGGTTNYTPTFTQTLVDQDGDDLTSEVMNPTKEVEITVRKRGGNYWAVRKVWAAGTPATGTSAPGEIRGSYLSTQTASTVVSASSLGTAPEVGDGILFIATAPGPSGSTTVNFTAPSGATQLADYGGSTFSPRIRVWYDTYAGESSWTFGSDSSIGRVGVIAYDGLTTFTAGSGVPTLDPASLANPDNAVATYIAVAGWDAGDDSTWTAPPSGYEVVQENTDPVNFPNTQTHIAAKAIATSGTEDPGAATFGPSSQAFSSILVMAS